MTGVSTPVISGGRGTRLQKPQEHAPSTLLETERGFLNVTQSANQEAAAGP